MDISKEKVRELVEKQFDGNYSKFARELEIKPNHIHKFLSTGSAGLTTIGALMKFCRVKGLKFEEYVDFT